MRTFKTLSLALLLCGCALTGRAQIQWPKGSMSRAQSEELARQAVEQRKKELAARLRASYDSKAYELGEYKLIFWDTVYGLDKAADGERSMFISMHGGGGTAPRANDQQWNNQKRLYTPAEGLYFVPRSPTNTWNMWHQEYMDDLLRQAIAAAVIFQGVNPDRVYITGYSAGGDGTYQMAPRMADHWAAAAMMAGHPGDAQAENLRNLPFAIYMGGLDDAYDRSHLAREWMTKLDLLALSDNGGYIHGGAIYHGDGHWMMQRDTVGIPWMAQFTRNAYPDKVVWIQDDVLRSNFYWVGVPKAHERQGAKIVAKIEGQTLDIEQSDSPVVLIGLNDRMLDLDKPVTVRWQGKTLTTTRFRRTASSMQQSLDDSPYSIQPPYPVVLRVERDGNAKAGATVKQL